MTKNCKHKFRYKNTIKATWSIKGYKHIKCENCNQLCNVSTISRILLAVLITLPSLPLILLIDILSYKLILAYYVYICFIIIITPYFVKLESLK